MALIPSTSLHFDSWERLRQWLPEASEIQLLTVFVWSGEVAGRAGEAAVQVRKETFEQLVMRSRGRLHRFLVQRCQCRDAHLADDIVQQVPVKLFLRADQFDPRRSFWGWLYRIARNEYIDSLRRLRPGDIGLGQQHAGDDEAEPWLDQRLPPPSSPEDAALRREFQERFDGAIAALPGLQRRVVQLKREGLKGKEIAEQLGISQAYVSQLSHEAAEILRETVAP
jgi:RNA polymerase sigma factor (sigma-70 family)